MTITEQRYGPTTGVFSGWVGLLMCAAAAVALAMNASTASVRFALVFAAFGVLVWCYMLRPRIIVRETGSTLVLRNAFSTWLIPLAAITVVRVKAITRVEVGDQGYDGIAVGRRIKAMVRGMQPRRGDGFADAGRTLGDPPRRESKHPRASSPEAIADLMTEQVLAAAGRAKEAGQPTGSVRRTWAWPELAVLAGLALGVVVTYLV